MEKLFKFILIICISFIFIGCAEKFTQDKKELIQKIEQEPIVLEENEYQETIMILSELDDLKPCDSKEITLLKHSEVITTQENFNHYPIFDENLNVKHVVEVNSTKKGVETNIGACNEGENIKVMKAIKHHL